MNYTLLNTAQQETFPLIYCPNGAKKYIEGATYFEFEWYEKTLKTFPFPFGQYINGNVYCWAILSSLSVVHYEIGVRYC